MTTSPIRHAWEAACQDLPTPVEVELDHLPDDRDVIAQRLKELLENQGFGTVLDIIFFLESE